MIFIGHDIIHAVQFAEDAHRQQVRRYTGEPYIVHLLSVAKMISCAKIPRDLDDYREAMIIAAILHDVVEDTPATIEEVSKCFGSDVGYLVFSLTDTPKGCGNRAVRKGLDRERLNGASEAVKIIKCADIIDNMHSICTHDQKFARTFLFEVGELIPLLKNKSSLYLELEEKYAYFNPLSTVEQRIMKEGW